MALLYEARAHALGGDRLAVERAIAEAAKLGRPEPLHSSLISVARTFLNEAFLRYSDAIAAGRRGESSTAESMFAAARLKIMTGRGGVVWRRVAERLVTECALEDGWGTPIAWLTDAAAFFHDHEHVHFERSCRSLLRRAGAPLPRRVRAHSAVPPELARLGVTERETEVLTLLGQGLTSREIGARLLISARTVDNHVEGCSPRPVRWTGHFCAVGGKVRNARGWIRSDSAVHITGFEPPGEIRTVVFEFPYAA